MIRQKYRRPKEGDDQPIPGTLLVRIIGDDEDGQPLNHVSPSAEAISRNRRKDDGKEYLFERPLPPDALLRTTEDFGPVYEMAFRPGISTAQSLATLRTIERVHRAKMLEMAAWTEAMRKAEADKNLALKRIQDDMEVEQLRAQLNVVKSRLEEKSKLSTEEEHFQQQVDLLRATYEKEKKKEKMREGALSDMPGSDDVPLFAYSSSPTVPSAGKKQKLYNALHYSSLYDGGEGESGAAPCNGCGETLTTSSTNPSANHHHHHQHNSSVSSSTILSPGGVRVSMSSPHVGMRSPPTVDPNSLSARRGVHEGFFQERSIPPSILNFSPAKSQLRPLRNAPPGSPNSDAVDLSAVKRNMEH